MDLILLILKLRLRVICLRSEASYWWIWDGTQCSNPSSSAASTASFMPQCKWYCIGSGGVCGWAWKMGEEEAASISIPVPKCNWILMYWMWWRSIRKGRGFNTFAQILKPLQYIPRSSDFYISALNVLHLFNSKTSSQKVNNVEMPRKVQLCCRACGCFWHHYLKTEICSFLSWNDWILWIW